MNNSEDESNAEEHARNNSNIPDVVQNSPEQMIVESDSDPISDSDGELHNNPQQMIIESDSDPISDDEELLQNNHQQVNSDSDPISDDEELVQNIPHQANSDSDADPISDNEELVQNNPHQANSDSDADPISDDEELVQNHPQQVNSDLDSDPISDEDNFANPNGEPMANHDEEPIVNPVENFVGAGRQPFVMNVEGHGLDVQLLAANGNIQAYEAFILFLAKALQQKETYTSMIENFKLINMMFDNSNLPEHMRDFWRIVDRRDEDFESEVVCTICWSRIGQGKNPTENCECGLCGPHQNNSELGTYFYVKLKPQINGLFNKAGIARDLLYPYTRTRRGDDPIMDIEDVYDGDEYRHHAAEGQFLHRNNHNYSFAMWADSVNPVKTANVHVLPVFFQVLELSPRARQRNTMLAAVYVGPRKPEMGSFLTPVMRELQDLFIRGVDWQTDAGEDRTSRFMTLIVSADSEERYRILGMTRHNGHFGCTFCYADGVRMQGAANNKLIYREKDDRNVPDRTNAEIRADSIIANEEGRRIRGVQTISALLIIPIDLRAAQLVEPMHCHWEGNFARVYRNLTNSLRPNHIREGDIVTISRRIMDIRTPTKLSRLPRSLTQFAHFTATEIRNVALFYWLPCAQDFMTQDQIQLCANFAEATFTMEKDLIPRDDLGRVQGLVNTYRQDFQRLFPEEEWVYNVHLIKHSIRCVRDLGPSWVASGFWFESLNRQVVNYLTSPTDRAAQVACRLLLVQMVDNCLDMPLNPRVRTKLREYIGKEKWDEQPEVATGAYIQDIEVGRPAFFDNGQIGALRAAGFDNIDPDLQVTKHDKVNIDGVLYQVLNERLTRYNNSIAHVNAQWDNEVVEFIEIVSIVTWEHGGGQQRGMFGNRFSTIGPAFGTTYMRIVERLENVNVVYVPLANVITPGVLVESNNRIYISRLPNRWDND